MNIQLSLDRKQSDSETLVFYIKNLNPCIIDLIKYKSEEDILYDDILFIKLYIMKSEKTKYDVFIDFNEFFDLIPIAKNIKFNQISLSIKKFFNLLS